MTPTEPPLPPLPPPGSPPAAPPPSAPSSGPDRRKVVLGAGVALAVAAVVAIVAALLGPGERVESAGPTDATVPPASTTTEPPAGSSTTVPDGTSTTTEPDTTTTVPEGGDAIQAMVDELMVFVEEERGLEFLERPDVVVLEGDAFSARYRELLEEDFAEQAELIEHFTGIYQALAVLPEGVTIPEAYAAFGDGAVGGFYVPETGELVVRGGAVTPFVRVVVAHELVHALDDQHFELYRPEYDDRDDEVGFGLQAVTEGNARTIENRYRATLSAAEQREVQAEELALSTGIDLSLLSYTFLQLQLLPYEAGEQLVGVLLDAEGQAALDGAFEEPPVTSEQVLDPERFLAGEEAVEVAPPPADGEVVEDGLFGVGTLYVLLSEAVGPGDARDAIEGWAGDWFVSWEDGDATCLRADFLMDDDGDADELEDALDAWLGGPADGELDRTAEDTVRLTVCS
jgi:hypothetical protein